MKPWPRSTPAPRGTRVVAGFWVALCAPLLVPAPFGANTIKHNSGGLLNSWSSFGASTFKGEELGFRDFICYLQPCNEGGAQPG